MDGVLFRVDAGPVIGMGHLQRSLSLAAAFRSANVPVLFMTNGDFTSEYRIERFGFEHIPVVMEDSWTQTDCRYTVENARSHGCSTIVVDGYYQDANYLLGLRHAGFFVCAIDDNAPHAFPCHMVVNGDVHARKLGYESPFEDTQFLLGPQYSILRPEFCEPVEGEYAAVVETVLVILGGADPHGVMPSILSALERVGGTFKVKAVIGPFFTNHDEIERAIQSHRRPIELIYAPDQVRSLMVEADIAISGGGQTLYELAASGCPTLALRIAANQDKQLAEFARSGFISLVGHAEDGEMGSMLVKKLEGLMDDYRQRKLMGENGRKIVDGHGALRVAESISMNKKLFNLARSKEL
jgi:UDP-2,4-diacetamido-2,4,6-trideoxy-beta-L-altropyranose hydrolase